MVGMGGSLLVLRHELVQGGGSKDTWVLTSAKGADEPIPVGSPDGPHHPLAMGRLDAARAADTEVPTGTDTTTEMTQTLGTMTQTLGTNTSQEA